ncbi:uncharacterized protein LOC128162308 [Crassostrea angulata]|uniref:uncharacterized protein LOC128162308 n=1 Tax=Magallana angulata TaxID=2784310 RepID=UPI0022B09729|nr:uncharacterized protein LOC128162308 [Crassostrea angulata]
MDSYMPKRNRLEESDFYQAQESSPRSHERMNMDLPTTSNISGTHMTNMNDMEVEPPSNRSQPIGHGVSRFTGSTRTVGRAALGGANRVLSKEQIRHFITSTVIPHHRSLTRAESRVNEPYSRPEDTNSAHKRPEMINHSSSAMSRTNMEEFSTNNETWLRNPGNFEEEEELSRQRPVAIVSPQTHHNPHNTQRETTAVPQAIPVPQRVLDFTNASQETRREARTVPQEIPETSSAVQVMPGQTIGASREGSVITGLPQGTQEKTCVPEITRVLNENKREVVIGSRGIRCSISLPQRTKLSVSVNCQHNVLSKNIEENDEIVDDDVNEFLQQFSLDKLNISPQEPANTRRAVDVSPWDPEYTLIPVDRYSCQELRGSERFVPCQDCFIDLNLFL